MIAGLVRDEIELIVPLELFDAADQHSTVDFVLDTGSTGFLALSMELVRQLGLKPRGMQRGQMADGSESFCSVVNVKVTWNGVQQRIDAQILGEPLIGTRMLRDCELRAKFEMNGEVAISELPPKIQ